MVSDALPHVTETDPGSTLLEQLLHEYVHANIYPGAVNQNGGIGSLLSSASGDPLTQSSPASTLSGDLGASSGDSSLNGGNSGIQLTQTGQGLSLTSSPQDIPSLNSGSSSTSLQGVAGDLGQSGSGTLLQGINSALGTAQGTSSATVPL